MNSKNFSRALDLLARESISTEKCDDIDLRMSTRVVPLSTVIHFLEKYNEGSLEEYYQKHKQVIDFLRPPEKSKEILKSLSIKTT